MEEQLVKLSHSQYLQIDRDYANAAKAVNLVYVSDVQPGIQRIKKGKGFAYIFNNKVINDKDLIQRISKLVIPPAWNNVWICPLENGHIQVTGFDIKNRKQYRYHNLWNTLRNETKFHRLYEFGQVLPTLRLQLEKDISGKELDETKVIALVVSLMERTYIRIGNSGYEKQNGSYGLTTLKDKHVKVEGEKLHFSFVGKKGVSQEVSLKNKKLARMVKQCRDIPGKELFQYFDDNGNRKSVDSGMINNYIKSITGMDFTAKDFRTWAGSLNILRAFKSIGEAIDDTSRKKNIVAALDEVSSKLGNTRTVCKKYYVHPGLINLYEKDNLSKYLNELDYLEVPDEKTGHTKDEKVLLKILKELAI
ncbi:MAG: DNA topoisomerase IB [Bacteroidota bacterium]